IVQFIMMKTVSIIIPCYNAAQYIVETVASVMEQNIEGEAEIILVDDGSTDDSKSLLKAQDWFGKIKYIHQANAGVSAARNAGFKQASGRYVCFFDADDLMSKDFLKHRILFLEQHKDYQFCCGHIQTFPVDKPVKYGAHDQIAEQILLYHPEVGTCPSNYVFETEFLRRNHFQFDERLSSTADRFYLIELAQKGKGGLVEQGELHYRIVSDSMSNQMSPKLVLDNELFLKLLQEKKRIPSALKNSFLYKHYLILGLSFLKIKNYTKGGGYLIKAFFK